MKNLMNTLIALSALVALSACEVKSESAKDFSAWERSTITKRHGEVGDIPTGYIFDCRRISDAQNVHYYYSLIADPKGVSTYNENGEKVTTYKEAEFDIQVTTSNYVGGDNVTHANKSVVDARVDFIIVERSQGYSEAFVAANKDTVGTLKAFNKRNPYFNNVKEGDVLFSMRSNPFSRISTNTTEQDMPGIVNGEDLECR